jgi:hypothetical protein
VPMWAYNLPDFAAAHATYALDALGDAGESLQSRPIRDAAVYAALAGRSVMHNGARAAAVARAKIPDPTIELWPDATHSLPMEQTASLDRTILAFMTTHDG